MCRPSSSRTWLVLVSWSQIMLIKIDKNRANNQPGEEGAALPLSRGAHRRSSQVPQLSCHSQARGRQCSWYHLLDDRAQRNHRFPYNHQFNNYLVNFMLRVNAIVDVTCLNKNQRSYLLCDSRRLSSFCNVATYLPRLQDCNVITIVTIWGRLTRKPWNQLQS